MTDLLRGSRDLETCEEKHVHPDVLKMLDETMPNEEYLYDLAELFNKRRKPRIVQYLGTLKHFFKRLNRSQG